MEHQISEYTFTIIEDGQVPLAGNFDTFSYTPMIAVVAIGIILLAVLAYTLWFETHSRRLRELNNSDQINVKYFFHPAKLLRDETDVEYSLASASFDR